MKDEINGIVATYIAGAVDELWHEVHAKCEEYDIEFLFHDILDIVEGHLERAADYIDVDLEDHFKFEGMQKEINNHGTL